MSARTTAARVAACAALSGACALAGCSNDPTLANGGSNGDLTKLRFIQIDRLGKPGIKELFLPFAQHDAYERATPLSQTSPAASAVASFVTGTGVGQGKRSAAIGAYVGSLLSSDVLVANLAVAAPKASYLGWETGGRIADDCTGSAPNAFGGRGLTDDVTSATLGLVYGTLATTANGTTPSGTAGIAATVPGDDGAETPGLASDNVACVQPDASAGTFPYLAAPI